MSGSEAAPAAGGSSFVVNHARADQTAAVFTLLPELLQARALPTRFLVAHPPGEASRLLGAAAFAPLAHPGRHAGFKGLCQVLPAWRRQGIGRALVQRLAAEVAAWDVPHLLSWGAHEEGPATHFMRSLGFQCDHRLHHFIGQTAATLPLCRRMAAALTLHARVPPGFEPRPLAEVPSAPLVALHCREFNARPGLAHEALQAALGDRMLRRLSFALWDGRTLAGYLIAGPGAGMPEVRYWASDPGLRRGWPAVLLLDAFVQRLAELGIAQARYHCHERARATLNIARRTGARLEAVREGFALALEVAA